jgi:hypothetical protein
MHDLQIDLSRLEKLGETVTITVKTAAGEEHRDVDLFSRENPIWEQIGVLVPSMKRTGEKVFTLRNARQTRDAMLKTLEAVLGLNVHPVPEAAAERVA